MLFLSYFLSNLQASALKTTLLADEKTKNHFQFLKFILAQRSSLKSYKNSKTF